MLQEVFAALDTDKSGFIDMKEFSTVLYALGFQCSMKDVKAVFDMLDDDRSGKLEYRELNTMLRKGAGSEKAKANLK